MTKYNKAWAAGVAIAMALILALGGCAGVADAINARTEKGTTALIELANVVENTRCKFRTVEVLAQMISKRGHSWAVGYGLSCPNLKPLLDLQLPDFSIKPAPPP